MGWDGNVIKKGKEKEKFRERKFERAIIHLLALAGGFINKHDSMLGYLGFESRKKSKVAAKLRVAGNRKIWKHC